MVQKGITDLFTGLKDIATFIEKALGNKHIVYLLVLISVAILFATLLKSVLRKIPGFQGEGTDKVNGYGNITAWCMSSLAVISIGWKAQGNIDKLIDGLAGPYGLLMIAALSIAAGYGMYNLFETKRKNVRLAVGLFTGGLLFTWWASNLLQVTKLGIGLPVIAALLALVIVWILNKLS
jgi:hypothetical protein